MDPRGQRRGAPSFFCCPCTRSALRRRDDPACLADRALGLDPTFPAANLVLGNLYLRTREYEQAVSSVNQAIALNPKDPEGYAVLANILSFMNRSPEAVPLMEQVFRLEPKHPPLYDMYMGRALLLSRRPDLALPHLRTCLSRAPDLTSCHRHLVVAYAQLGRIDQARAAASDWQRYSSDRTVRQVIERGDWQPGPERDYIVEGLIKAGVPE